MTFRKFARHMLALASFAVLVGLAIASILTELVVPEALFYILATVMFALIGADVIEDELAGQQSEPESPQGWERQGFLSPFETAISVLTGFFAGLWVTVASTDLKALSASLKDGLDGTNEPGWSSPDWETDDEPERQPDAREAYDFDSGRWIVPERTDVQRIDDELQSDEP